jgi:hypothetical protein
MSKGRRGSDAAERLAALLQAGDHGAARRLAARIVADPAANAEDREAAGETLARTAPDAAVVIAGALGIVAAVGVAAWVLLH